MKCKKTTTTLLTIILESFFYMVLEYDGNMGLLKSTLQQDSAQMLSPDAVKRVPLCRGYLS